MPCITITSYLNVSDNHHQLSQKNGYVVRIQLYANKAIQLKFPPPENMQMDSVESVVQDYSKTTKQEFSTFIQKFLLKNTLMIESDYCTSRAIKFYVCANITSRWLIRNCLSYYTPQWFFKPINNSNSMNQSIPTDKINQIMGNNDLLVYVMAPNSLTLKSWKVGTRVSAFNNQISYFYPAMPSNHCF